jgi:PAS domain S-box-containing protein
MADDGVDGHDRVLLLFEDRRNRELLSDWLTRSTAFDLVVPDGEPTQEFDICLCDGAALSARESWLEARKGDEDPVFLPVVLCVPEDRVEASEEAALGPDSVVDDVFGLPTTKASIHRRVTTLLETRRASREVAEREHQYRELVRLTPEAIVVVQDGVVAFANDSAAELFGVADSDDLAGEPVESLAHEAEPLVSLVEDVESAGGLDSFRELALVREHEPQPVPVSAAGVELTYDGEPAVQLVVRDLSNERRRERQLDLYARAIESAAQGITIADAGQPDNPIVYANPAFERITGYSLPEILGRNCRFLQGEDTDPEQVAELRAAIDAERAVSVELLNYRNDGTPFWNRLDVVPVSDDDGEVTHFLGLQRDVTMEKRREQRLAVLDRVLRHNLRNRLAVIKGYAQRIAEGVDDPATEAGNVVNAADDLLDLTENIRQFRDVVLSEETALTRRNLAVDVGRAIEDVSTQFPDAAITYEAPETAYASVHDSVPIAVEELLELAVEDDPASANLTVTVTGDATPSIRLRDDGDTLSEGDVATIVEGTETPLQHPLGVELWFVKWAVEHSNGSFVVDGTDPLELVLRLRASDE